MGESMKKLLKQIIIVAVITTTILAKSYKILSTDIESYINQDGTVDFIETREFSFEGDYTFVYQVIPKKGFDSIFDIQVLENGIPYTNADTKEKGTFLIEERKRSYRIYLYHSSSNENKTFTIKYSLKNPFTVGPFDSQFYWIYLSNDWEKSPGDVSITQRFTSETSNDLHYALEWPLNSNKYNFETNEGTASFSSSNFSKKNEMKLRTVFPSSYLTDQSINNEIFSLAGLMQQKRDYRLANYFIISLTLFSIFVFTKFYRRYYKQHTVEVDENKSFDTFPSNDHPIVINSLFYRELTMGPTGGGILSTLFELAAAKKLSIEVVESGWKMFKSKKLKITVLNTDIVDLKSDFAKSLLKRINKFGNETTFSSVFGDMSLKHSEWKKLKKEKLNATNWVDTSSKNEKVRIAILQFFMLIIILVSSVIYKTFFGFLSILPFIFFISTLMGSRLSKDGQRVYNEWTVFMDQLQKGQIDVKKFDPDLMLQYCIALGTQPEHLKKIIKNIESTHQDGFIWMYHGYGDTSSVSSAASMVSDIASTGTTISASFGGGGDGGGGGGGAGGGGGGGAG